MLVELVLYPLTFCGAPSGSDIEMEVCVIEDDDLFNKLSYI